MRYEQEMQNEINELTYKEAARIVEQYNKENNIVLTEKEKTEEKEWFVSGAHWMIDHVLGLLEKPVGNVAVNPSEDYMRGLQDGANLVKRFLHMELKK